MLSDRAAIAAESLAPGRGRLPPALASLEADSKPIRVSIETLRPTQMAVGMRAVTYKRRKFENRASKPRDIDRVLSRRPIPAVRAPSGELFIVDNHHFALALWQAEVEAAYAHVIADKSHMSTSAFFRQMEAAGFLYPFDEEGNRVRPERLPNWLHALRHDPYRDLAWEVREAGAFTKVGVPYSEFRWATFFRGHIPMRVIRGDHEGAVRKALKLARSRDAADLPGFIGVRN